LQLQTNSALGVVVNLEAYSCPMVCGRFINFHKGRKKFDFIDFWFPYL